MAKKIGTLSTRLAEKRAKLVLAQAAKAAECKKKLADAVANNPTGIDASLERRFALSAKE